MTALSALVDELMGKDRNAGPNEKRMEIRWDTDDVCKHFLCGFCPAELFTNTRSDLGICNKTHDERAKKAYDSSSRLMKMGYEEEFLRYLQQCWQEVERRIRRNHQRLQLSEEKSKLTTIGNSETDEKIQELNDRITKMLTDIEELGSQGEVAQAQAMNKVCEQLKEEREQLQSQKGGIMDQFSVQEKQMEVCEVCGAFLIVGDAQSRVDDHLMGKQHMGYAKIKAAIAELKDKLTVGPPSRHSRTRSQERNNGDRRISRDRSRDRSDRRSSYRRSSPERERSTRRSSRERSRRSSRERSRRSSRDRKSGRDRRRSRDRTSRRDSSRERRDDRDSRRKRSRDRERSRSRDHDRKRSRRSRSKDRKSSRSKGDESRSRGSHSDRHHHGEDNNKAEKEQSNSQAQQSNNETEKQTEKTEAVATLNSTTNNDSSSIEQQEQQMT